MININIALFILRLVLGIIFLVHGLSKRKMWKMEPSETMPGSMLRIMRFLSITETLGGLALILGFMTSFAALGICFIMIGALYLKITKWHIPFTTNTQTGWEFDLINLAAALILVLLGGGGIALDFIFN